MNIEIIDKFYSLIIAIKKNSKMLNSCYKNPIQFYKNNLRIPYEQVFIYNVNTNNKFIWIR
ncbi:hypothetical protein GCM10012288_11860 [Malaciobacter pacificus]|nr:hypothetical protein GCM10012288_11860 [Malaciobacter pacificus]